MAKNRKRRGRGEGGIYQEKNGQWQGRISLGYDEQGQRIRKAVVGESKQEVLDTLKALDPGLLKATNGNPSLCDWLDTWHEMRKGTVADSTRWRDKKSVDKVKKYAGRILLAQVDAIYVERLYRLMQDKGESVDCVRRCAIMLGTAFRFAIKRKLVGRNPVRDVDKPRVDRKEVEVASREEIQALLKAAVGNRLEALFILACTSGMRQGEMFALDWASIDLDANVIHVVKSLMEVDGAVTIKDAKTRKSRRTIALPPMTIEALRNHKKKMLAEGNIAAPVFCSPEGGWLRKANFYHRVWTPLLTAAGLSIKFHSLRHAHATLLLAGGTDAKTVSERLGHSSVAFTLDTYTKVTNDQQRAAAAKIAALLGSRYAKGYFGSFALGNSGRIVPANLGSFLYISITSSWRSRMDSMLN